MTVAFSIAIFFSRPFSTKTVWLYWFLIAIAVIVCWRLFGAYHTYAVDYAWDRRHDGVTKFEFYRSQPDWLSREVVRWQVEPELSKYLAAGPLRRTHGSISVRVVTIVPIAVATLDCDCFGCCAEEADRTDSAR